MKEQTELDVKLSGFQRFQLVKIWHKRGREGDKEEFLKKVCAQKGLIYVPPIKVGRKV